MFIHQPIVRPGVRLFLDVDIDIDEDAGRLVCLIHNLSGEIKLGPRAWLTFIREEITNLENIARKARCAEMRIEGRDWSRVLKPLGYEPWPEGEGFALRKAL